MESPARGWSGGIVARKSVGEGVGLPDPVGVGIALSRIGEGLALIVDWSIGSCGGLGLD
jgi:hypothetical protein